MQRHVVSVSSVVNSTESENQVRHDFLSEGTIRNQDSEANPLTEAIGLRIP